MFYIDTSVLVTALTIETRTPEIQRRLSDNPAEGMAISDWTLTEFSSALSGRSETASSSQRIAKALTVFEDLCASTFEILPVLRADFTSAARMADQFDLGLRAADALHLVISVRNSAVLMTLDKGLAKACAMVGAGHQLL